jgi:hypothetical protein
MPWAATARGHELKPNSLFFARGLKPPRPKPQAGSFYFAVCSSRRGSSFLAVLIERPREILCDVLGGAAFDLVTLQHVNQLAVLEQRDLR